MVYSALPSDDLPIHAGIIPYLNIAIGVKVFIGLTTLVLLFYGVTKYAGDYVDNEEID